MPLPNIFRKSAEKRKAAPAKPANLLNATSLSTPNASIGQSWNLLKRYLTESDDKVKGRLLLAGVTGLTIAGLGGEIYISQLLGDFGTAFQALSPKSSLQEKDIAIRYLGLCIGAGMGMMVTRGALWYCERTLHKNWRDWQTRAHLSQWLGNRVHNRLQKGVIENPGLLIKQNDNSMPGDVVGLGIGLLQAAVRLPVFSYVLWNLSGTAQFNILGNAVSIPGYMTWGTMAFAAIGTWMGHKAGNPLSPLYSQHQKLEAAQDNDISYVQANSESILLADGEPVADKMLGHSMTEISDNWHKINLYETALLTLNDGYNRIGEFLPYALLFPLTMQAGFNLGILAPAMQAIMNVKSSLSWYFDSRAHIGRLRASINQTVHLESIMNEAAAQDRTHFSANGESTAPVIAIREDEQQDGIEFSNLTVLRPQTGEVLFKNANIKLHPGEKMMLMAPAGSGKTTMLRAMKGVIDHGDGEIVYNKGRTRMLVPQNRHIPPTLTLREILVYPAIDTVFNLTAMEDALRKVGLERLISDLHDESIKGRHLSGRLSGGEHQKLNMARILVIRPDELIADELTSALDEETEFKLYSMLLRELPNTSVLNISHHKNLIPLHTTLAVIENNQMKVQNLNAPDPALNKSAPQGRHPQP
jgi:putative ATP-binding cassette transporter